MWHISQQFLYVKSCLEVQEHYRYLFPAHVNPCSGLGPFLIFGKTAINLAFISSIYTVSAEVFFNAKQYITAQVKAHPLDMGMMCNIYNISPKCFDIFYFYMNISIPKYQNK